MKNERGAQNTSRTSASEQRGQHGVERSGFPGIDGECIGLPDLDDPAGKPAAVRFGQPFGGVLRAPSGG